MTEFVAEIGANHNGSMIRATDLIFAANKIGCSAVKFQFFGPRGLYADGIKPNPAGFPRGWLPPLRDLTNHLGMRLGCSVFDVESAHQVAEHVDFVKVSSYSILDAKLLGAVEATKRPTVIATGMASLKELYAALYNWRDRDRLTLLHCVSAYPVLAKDCHLANIGLLRRAFACDVGWSDHSVDQDVIMRAAGRWRSQMIECHLDLCDGKGQESGAHCWTPKRLSAIISAIRFGEQADGVAGKPVDAELPELPWRADPDDGLRPTKSIRCTIPFP
jgi:sialic acid synthase SpsE